MTRMVSKFRAFLCARGWHRWSPWRHGRIAVAGTGICAFRRRHCLDCTMTKTEER